MEHHQMSNMQTLLLLHKMTFDYFQYKTTGIMLITTASGCNVVNYRGVQTRNIRIRTILYECKYLK